MKSAKASRHQPSRPRPPILKPARIYRIEAGPKGHYVLEAIDDGHDKWTRVAGPLLRGAAVDYIKQRNLEIESEAHEAAAEWRAYLDSEAFIVDLLTDAIRDSPSPPRGRPPEGIREQRVAVEYYWSLRQGKRRTDTSTIRAVSKRFECSSDFVRKCRRKFARLAEWDSDLIVAFRADLDSRVAPAANARKVLKVSKASKVTDAEAFLRRALSHGPVAAALVYEQAKSSGHSERTIDRAKTSLALISSRAAGRWMWQLP